MDKYSLVAYLSNLEGLMSAQDRNGAVMRSATIGREYNRAYTQLHEMVLKEEEDAKSKDQKHED